jgi:tripartite-type tricarboxylate transporter receptor subunit TctC
MKRTVQAVIAPLAVAIIALHCARAGAQAYPVKPVRIVTSEAGGGSDVIVRLLAQKLSAALGQQAIVENRGGGVIPGEIVAKSPPDGYTLLYYGSTLWILPLMRKDVPYDVLRDFAPVTWGTSSSNILVVHPSVPAKSVKELIALAKANPKKLNYASGAAGTANHMAAALFINMARVNIVRIPYRGTTSALNGVLAGDVDLMFSGPAPADPLVKARRLRALGVTSARPWPGRPELPSIAQAGLPGYEAVTMTGIFVPAKTPDAIIARLSTELDRAIKSTEMKDKLADGVEAVGGPPERLAAALRSEIARLGKLIADTGIKDD